jgi:hypothetical protein
LPPARDHTIRTSRAWNPITTPLAERELSVRTDDLYRHLLRLYILPTFGTLDLDEITAPRVREWRAERLRTTGANWL